MNKAEFLSSLRSRLAALPAEDVERSVDYYSEMIDDRIEDGMTEEEAVLEMGDPAKAAEDIIAETPLKTIVREKMRNRRAPSAGTVILLILGSPIWLPLLLTAAIMLLSFFIVLWALVLVAFVVAFALAASAVAVFIFAFKLGISGAALATVTSQLVSLIILLIIFRSGRSILKPSVLSHLSSALSISRSRTWPPFCLSSET